MSKPSEVNRPCEERLPDLVDLAVEGGQGLTLEVRRSLETHLAACAACRGEFEALRADHRVLVASRQEPEPLHLAGFAARTADRAEAFRDRSPRGLWWALTRGMRWALLTSTASVVAAMALVVVGTGPREAAPVAGARVMPAAVAVQDGTFDAAPDDLGLLGEPDELVRQAMLEPVGVGSDSAFEALDDDMLEDVLFRLQSGG